MPFLIVDDDELSRELLLLLIEAAGHSVEAVASGEECLLRLSKASPPPGIILIDMQMPGLAGSPLAAAIRAATPRSTRLLAMSGSQPSASSLKGFDGFLLKPFTVEDLLCALDQTSTTDVEAAAPAQPSSGIGSDAASTDYPPINEQIYTKMCEIMPESQLREMYALSIADARKRIVMMAALADFGDDKQYRLEAHAIKGGAGFIGATELFKLAGAAEREGLDLHAKANSGAKIDLRAGTSDVTATLDQFSLACDRLERILVERIRS